VFDRTIIVVLKAVDMAPKQAKDAAHIIVPRMRGRFSLKRAKQKFARDIERVDSALGRMGNSPLDRLKWLLSFAETDLSQLREGDWLNLQSDLRAFIFEEGVVTGAEDPLKLNREGLRTLKGEIRNLILAIVRGGSHSLELPKLRHVVGRVKRQGRLGRVLHVIQGGDARALVLLDVFKLLEVEGPRLKKCTECPKLFVSVKRQAYCSLSCSQKARTRRYYGNHSPEVLSEKRHEALKRRIEKKSGRPTRVARKLRHRS
jgi:hypothetical protein